MEYQNLGEKKYNIGEKPGRGTYRCIMCDKWMVTLQDDSERLPFCKSIGCAWSGQAVQYKKIEERDFT